MNTRQTPAPHARLAAVGLLLGFTVSRLGFTDWDEVHRMFTLASPRLWLAFVGAVVLSMVGWAVFARGRALPRKPIHRGTLLGGLLFGIGWAITGCCPAAALAQLGEGKLAALATVVGILAGTFVYQAIHARFFRWDRGSCGS